jgi:hypothetical protein
VNAILKVLLALDIFLFRVITLGKSLPGETASAAAYNAERTGKIFGRIFRPLIDLLFRPFEKNHCRSAWHWQNHLYYKD